jgi:hypothetical protein
VRHLLACFLLTISLAGCRTVDLSTGAPHADDPTGETALIWLWGLIGDDISVDAPQGAARVQVYRSFGGWLVAVLTIGILQPMHVEVWPVAAPEQPPPPETK